MSELKRMAPARSPRSIVCRARARQGCPRNQKALRARFFGGSTVDRRWRDMDLALKICAPGLFSRNFQQSGLTASRA